MRAGLPLCSPLTGLSAEITDRFRRPAIRLQACYSVHDLRHAFTVRLYKETKNVHQVEKALGHAMVVVMETYLRSLGMELPIAFIPQCGWCTGAAIVPLHSVGITNSLEHGSSWLSAWSRGLMFPAQIIALPIALHTGTPTNIRILPSTDPLSLAPMR